MRGLIKRLSILISVLVVILGLSSCGNNKECIQTPVRDVEVKSSNIDAESIFNSYYNAEIKAEDSVVTFSGDKHYNSSSIDLVSLSEEDYSTIHFDYEYDGKENVFVLKVEVSDDNNETESEIIKGIPFYDENNTIDIVFNVEGELLLLSDFTQSGIENCGLFKKVLKKASSACKSVKNAIEDVAEATLEVVKETAPVIVAVGAVAVIYGASVVASGGATLAFAPGVGAAVGAVLEGTLIAGTAIAGTYLAASIGADALDYLAESKLVERLEEIVSLDLIKNINNSARVYYIAYLRDNSLVVNEAYQLNYVEALSILSYCGYFNALSFGINVISYTNMNDILRSIADLLKNENVGKNKIGIYTRYKVDAAKLAYVLGGIFSTKPEIHGELSAGYFYHFHDIRHLIHVWYSEA